MTNRDPSSEYSSAACRDDTTQKPGSKAGSRSLDDSKRGAVRPSTQDAGVGCRPGMCLQYVRVRTDWDLHRIDIHPDLMERDARYQQGISHAVGDSMPSAADSTHDLINCLG